jgi:hypothetical protein
MGQTRQTDENRGKTKRMRRSVIRSVILWVGPFAWAGMAITALAGCSLLVGGQTRAGPGSPIPCTDVCGNDVQCEAGCVDAPPATGYVH